MTIGCVSRASKAVKSTVSKANDYMYSDNLNGFNIAKKINKGASRAGWIAGGIGVGIGVAANIYFGSSASETVEDAIVDTTFVVAEAVVGMLAGMLTAAYLGCATVAIPVTIMGVTAGLIFSAIFNTTNTKEKYKRFLGDVYERIR